MSRLPLDSHCALDPPRECIPTYFKWSPQERQDHSAAVHWLLFTPLSTSMVPSFLLFYLLALCLDPQSVAAVYPTTPTLASCVFTDGSVKSGQAPKMLLDFCSPLMPRPYGAAGEEGRGSAIPSCLLLFPLGSSEWHFG